MGSSALSTSEALEVHSARVHKTAKSLRVAGGSGSIRLRRYTNLHNRGDCLAGEMRDFLTEPCVLKGSGLKEMMIENRI